jgi:hypothetical protein
MSVSLAFPCLTATASSDRNRVYRLWRYQGRITDRFVVVVLCQEVQTPDRYRDVGW